MSLGKVDMQIQLEAVLATRNKLKKQAIKLKAVTPRPVENKVILHEAYDKKEANEQFGPPRLLP